MKFLIVNGPNINMLGVREPDIYGTLTYEGLCDTIAQAARGMGVEVEFFQSNSEGDIVTAIQNALGRMDGIVINPAAYTHTSVAILDARGVSPAQLCGHGVPLPLCGRGQGRLCARAGDAEARH